jgi:hypothetical protein
MSNANTIENPHTAIAGGAPPKASVPLDDAPYLPKITLDEPTAMQVFFAWEKLRLIYNIVLVFTAVLICWPILPFIFVETLGAALIANVMYCAGPVAECYLCWFGVPRLIARAIVFVLGLLLSIGVTIESAREAWQLVPPVPQG